MWTRKRTKHTLPVLGATIILGTFIAKDARKDKLRELSGALESTRNFYNIQVAELRTLEELKRFEIQPKDEKKESLPSDPRRQVKKIEELAMRRVELREREFDMTAYRRTVESYAQYHERLDYVRHLNMKVADRGPAWMVTHQFAGADNLLYTGGTTTFDKRDDSTKRVHDSSVKELSLKDELDQLAREDHDVGWRVKYLTDVCSDGPHLCGVFTGEIVEKANENLLDLFSDVSKFGRHLDSFQARLLMVAQVELEDTNGEPHSGPTFTM